MTLIGDITQPTARKRHVCWWCGEAIPPGDRYSRWAWHDGYTIQAIRAHPECRAAWATLGHGDDEIHFGEFARGCCCESGRCKCSTKQDAVWAALQLSPDRKTES